MLSSGSGFMPRSTLYVPLWVERFLFRAICPLRSYRSLWLAHRTRPRIAAITHIAPTTSDAITCFTDESHRCVVIISNTIHNPYESIIKPNNPPAIRNGHRTGASHRKLLFMLFLPAIIAFAGAIGNKCCPGTNRETCCGCTYNTRHFRCCA